MALNPDEEAWIEGLLSRFKDDRNQASDWEKGFLDDQVERFEEYGIETRFSPKQWEILARVARKYNYAGLDRSEQNSED